MTNQPVWKAIDNLGDASPVDHGGFFVFIDTTGVYPPEAALLETPPDEKWSGYWDDEAGDEDKDYSGWHKRAKWTLYRFILEPHTYQDGCLSDNPFHPNQPAWYGAPDDLQSIANTVGSTVFDLVSLLTSEDPVERAMGYQTMIYNYGPFEFDQYPLELTEEEANERAEKWLSEIKHQQI